jgi:hypothetical protein
MFVAGADLLQSMVNLLVTQGILVPPLPIPNTDFPIVQYADDTLRILQACPSQLIALKNLLHTFTGATGLQVNYAKSCLMAINIDNHYLQYLANTFGCAVGTLPFSYLGLPLGTTKPTIHDLTPITDQVERRLNASARFLDYGGRLQLVRSVLSSLPMHYLCSLKVQKSIIRIVDRSRRHCLWAKEEDSDHVNSLAAWSVVCQPKKHGGLGVLNLELQNKALLMKQLNKFYCKENIPWVQLVWNLYPQGAPHAQSSRGSFWWRDVFSFVHDYRSITRCIIGSGNSVLFWKDLWHTDGLLCDQFPRLYSFALDEDVTVADMARAPDLSLMFVLPLSAQAFQELSQIHMYLQGLVSGPNDKDTRVFPWGNSTYTSAKFYNFIFAQAPTDHALPSIWKSKCLPKLRVFAWLLMKDRLNTKDLIIRKSWKLDDGPSCVLCTNQMLETRDHLFFECPFAVACWEFTGIRWDSSELISPRFALARDSFIGPCFMEIAICAAWNIWKERNDLIFKQQNPSLRRWKVRFQSDLLLHQHRVKPAMVQPLLDWILATFT